MTIYNHISVTKTCMTVASLGFTVLSHPTYSPDLALSDDALFNIKGALHGEWFPFTEVLQVAVHVWYHSTPKEWFHERIQRLPRRWQ
jgi:hypothetical protein